MPKFSLAYKKYGFKTLAVDWVKPSRQAEEGELSEVLKEYNKLLLWRQKNQQEIWVLKSQNVKKKKRKRDSYNSFKPMRKKVSTRNSTFILISKLLLLFLFCFVLFLLCPLSASVLSLRGLKWGELAIVPRVITGYSICGAMEEVKITGTSW